MKKVIFGLLLFLSCSAARAEYALVDQIVYWLNDEYTSAAVENFLTEGGAVTVPSYVTYRGVKYKVVALDKNDFNTSTRNTYNVSSLVFGEGLLTDLATLDMTTAGECIYNKPVGKDKNGRQQYAEGMSIRLAEIVASCYGIDVTTLEVHVR